MTASVLAHTTILWRMLVAATAIGLRVSLDDVLPRGRVGRHRSPLKPRMPAWRGRRDRK